MLQQFHKYNKNCLSAKHKLCTV